MKSKPCQWCVATSSQIDSIEQQLEEREECIAYLEFQVKDGDEQISLLEEKVSMLEARLKLIKPDSHGYVTKIYY